MIKSMHWAAGIIIAFFLILILTNTSSGLTGVGNKEMMKSLRSKKRIAIIQYDDRHNVYLESLKDQNRIYANKYGYDYIFHDKWLHDGVELPPYWIKVALMLYYLPQYDAVMWLDTDAVIHDFFRPVEWFFHQYPNKEIFICRDYIEWSSEFNVGVFIIRNTPDSIRIVQEWMNQYNPNDWSKVDGKWLSSGEWAGKTYEQGSLVHLYFNLPKSDQSRFERLDWRVFQSSDPNNIASNTFTLHFAGNFKARIPAYIENYEILNINNGADYEIAPIVPRRERRHL